MRKKKKLKLNLTFKLRISALLVTFCLFSFFLTAFLRTYSEFVTKPGLLHGVIGSTVYVNDQLMDYNYYMGLNYTTSTNGTLPTLNNKQIYKDENLVYTSVTYDGTDVNDSSLVGYVSYPNEQQNKYVYYKVFPVNNNGTDDNTSDDYIEIPLIDSPFGDRPNNKAFNGWVTNYNGATISFDLGYYQRTAKVPVSYTNGKPTDIDIIFNVSWINATTANITSSTGSGRSNWTSPINSLNAPGMKSISVIAGTSYTLDMTGYYKQVYLEYYDEYYGYYDINMNQYTSGYCYNYWDGCEVYELINGEMYQNGESYYEDNGYGTLTYVNPNNLPLVPTVTYSSGFSSTTIMAGYYSRETVAYGNSRNGYYDSSGNAQSGNCTSGGGCDLYRLIQYRNSSNNIEYPESGKSYYYLVTRDTNILVMTVSVTNTWRTNQTKPFTLTSINNNRKYNVTWTYNSYIRCMYDTVIEHLSIDSGYTISNETTPATGATNSRYMYGYWKNFKIGRGITRTGSNCNAYVVVGGYGAISPTSSSAGTASDVLKYHLMIESGFFRSTVLTNGNIGDDTNVRYKVYTEAKSTYGNDYDRVKNDNNKLQIYYVVAGSHGGSVYARDNKSLMFDTTVKSGSFGTGMVDYAYGIYAGSLTGGTLYSPKRLIVEGGWINNINGGPISDSSLHYLNDTYIQIKGGSVDSISGGAGRSLTYGNRIVQVTGGMINYNVFGGSNGIEGNTSNDTYRGILYGTPYVYIGGNAVIGNTDNSPNDDPSWGAGLGNVFGIGNGNSTADSIGTCDNSNVVIDGNATINGSVYGGGNYGGVGLSTSGGTTTNIRIYGGSILGSVYGAGNRSGSGSTSNTSNINIQMTNGLVGGSIYGGSNIRGTVYGNSSVSVNGGNVTNSVYGGGQGGFANNTNSGTFVSANATVTIGTSSAGPTIGDSVYGGSAFGTVNATSQTTTLSSSNTTVTVNNGTINGSVYGGGQGGTESGTNYNSYVVGNATININNGTINNVYGGADDIGIVVGNVVLNITNGHILNNVYGGGRGGYISTALPGTFIGRNVSVTIGNSNNEPKIDGSIYGGSAFGTVNGLTNSTNLSTYNTSVTVEKVDCDGDIYGAGQGGTVGTNNFSAYVLGNATTNIKNAKVNNIYGGSDDNGIVVGSVDLDVIDGTIRGDIYGGGRGGYVSTNFNGTFVGRNVDVTIGSSSLEPTISGSVYGGSAFGTVNGLYQTTTLSTYNTRVTVEKADITGNLYGAGKGGTVGTTNYNAYVMGNATTNIKNIKVDNIYGGSDANGVVIGSVDLDVQNGTIRGNIYGGGRGGYVSESVPGTFVGRNVNVTIGTSTLEPSIAGSVYAGSAFGTVNGLYQSTNLSTYNTSLTVEHADIAGSLFGAGQGGVFDGVTYDAYVMGNATTNVKNIKVDNIYGGSDENGSVIGSVDLDVLLGTIRGNVYGGGRGGYVSSTVLGTYVGRAVNVTIGTSDSGPSITGSVYGGSAFGTVNGLYQTTTLSSYNTDVTVHNGNIANVFGGGQGGTLNGTTYTPFVEGQIHVIINNGTIGSVFGGNDLSGIPNGTTRGSVSTVLNNGTIQSAFGGGNASSVRVTDIYLQGATVTTLYGGSNQTGVVNTSYVTVTSGQADYVYGGNNAGTSTGITNVTISGATINNTVYGGGDRAPATTTNITISGNGNKILNIFGGGNSANAGTTNITISGRSGKNVFGGSNSSGTVGLSNVNISSGNYDYVYGSNNAGGTTTTANIDITGGVFTDIYGGGNIGQTGTADTNITNASVIGTVFGGGKQAGVSGGTDLDIINSTITHNVFGGGDNGIVGTVPDPNAFVDYATLGVETNVYVSSSNIGDSIYAGGNGVDAIVYGNTTLNIDGTTNVTNHVFGGGNAAETGSEVPEHLKSLHNDSSTGIVNITGATIGGNVYGGANISKIWGITIVNIGKNAVNNNALTTGIIDIGGTVFGGGEKDIVGEMNFHYISVTVGITINIDASNHTTFNIDGSIFGSGNASSSGGYSNVYIKNYGTRALNKTNISIQRADLVVFDNSNVELIGTTDSTTTHFNTLFTLNRILHVKLKNNSTLFLRQNANLVAAFSSVVDENGEEVPAVVEIDENNVDIIRNVDNRIFLYSGPTEVTILNLSNDESNGSDFAPVIGMTFFGLYNYDRYGNVQTAFYDSTYNNNEVNTAVSSTEFYTYFTMGSYIMGQHKLNHDITVDGFYTNVINTEDLENEQVILKAEYIDPTPESAPHYMWTVGEAITPYTVELAASKFSTLGAKELPLISHSAPNTTFTVVGFNYDGLTQGIELIPESSVPRVAQNSTRADNEMSLVMKTTNMGWLTNGTTMYTTDDDNLYSGTLDYYSENSDAIPILFFYLYHSKNLGTNGEMGFVTIALRAVTPIDDLTSTSETILITVKLSRVLETEDSYEGAITSGKQYEMFSSSKTNISSRSSLSAYFSLYMEDDQTIYGAGYHRSLVSTYVYPANTKITMIDFSSSENPEYYYYVVSPQDVVEAQAEYNLYRECSYNLSKFIKMGSSSPGNIYDDAVKNSLYYDDDNDRAIEEFIFMFDFSESNITQDIINASILIELRNGGNQTILGVLDYQQLNTMFYNIYTNENAVIDVLASLSDSTVYVGDTTNLYVSTKFLQSLRNGYTVTDTNYYNQKLGLKISLLDSHGNTVDGYSLMGVSFTLNGIAYYPRTDGSYRINIAQRVANVSSNFVINTANSNLATDTYTIVIESFGSSDGIYYGLVSSDTETVTLNVVNAIYGLEISAPDNNVVIDKTTGNTLQNNNVLPLTVKYSSGLANPKLRISLKRRDYTTEYSTNYVLVDLADYVTNTLNATPVQKEYVYSNNPVSNTTQYFYFKPNIMSGTYKLTISLYDNNNFIGEEFQYIIIK